MNDIDARELADLKQKRQATLLAENPPSRIIQAIEDEYGRLNDTAPTVPPTINPRAILDNTEDETFIRFGKIKINGMWEVMVTIGATIFAIVGAWINFDLTLTKHTNEIQQLQAEVIEYRIKNDSSISLLNSNIALRINSIEKQLLTLHSMLEKYDYRYIQEMSVLQKDLNILKQNTAQHNADITQLLRSLNSLESKVGNFTK